MSSLRLVACSLRLAACSSRLEPRAIASDRWRSSPSVHQDVYSCDLLRWSSRWSIQYLDAGLSLDPNLGTAAERFVWAVNNFAGTINCNFVSVVIWFVSLHRNDWFVVTIGCITPDYVLIDMYIFFHLYLSVMRWSVYPGASWRLIGLCRASSSFSCLPSSAASAIDALSYLYQDNPVCQIFFKVIHSLLLDACRLKLFLL